MNNQMRDRGSNKSQVCVGLEIQVCFVLGFFFGGGGGYIFLVLLWFLQISYAATYQHKEHVRDMILIRM